MYVITCVTDSHMCSQTHHTHLCTFSLTLSYRHICIRIFVHSYALRLQHTAHTYAHHLCVLTYTLTYACTCLSLTFMRAHGPGSHPSQESRIQGEAVGGAVGRAECPHWRVHFLKARSGPAWPPGGSSEWMGTPTINTPESLGQAGGQAFPGIMPPSGSGNCGVEN